MVQKSSLPWAHQVVIYLAGVKRVVARYIAAIKIRPQTRYGAKPVRPAQIILVVDCAARLNNVILGEVPMMVRCAVLNSPTLMLSLRPCTPKVFSTSCAPHLPKSMCLRFKPVVTR